MLGRKFEARMWLAIAVCFIAVVIIAPLIGAFAFSPLLVAGGIQPYPLAAALGCMIAEALAVIALVFLVLRSKK
jgi:hypothetical protein